VSLSSPWLRWRPAPARWHVLSTLARTDDAGRFLHDFSYAGYAHGEREPTAPSSFVVRVATDGGDMTDEVQGALDAVAALDGGVVLLGPGRFRIDGTLAVAHSRVVLKGAGRDKTWLVFTKASGLDFAENLRFGGVHRLEGDWPLVEDGATRAFTVRVGTGDAGYSEFHHSLATANLIDESRFDDGFSTVNRRLESTGAGHTGTENVFWNVSGAGLLRSMQWGWGYVIGADGLAVALDEVFIAEGTQPSDWAEGLDAGATLEPRSLYEDQRRRLLGR
jgi:hypothetical protein